MCVRRLKPAMAHIGLVLASILSPSCEAKSFPFNEGFECPEPDRRCPQGQVCNDQGRCEVPTDADAGADGGDGGVPISTACGAPSQFGGDFDSTPYWLSAFTNMAGDGGSGASINGRYELVVPAVAQAYVAANSRFGFRLKDDRISVEVPPSTGDVSPSVLVFSEAVGSARISREDPTRVAGELLDGDDTTILSASIAVTEDERWFSFREGDGMLHLEVSADNNSWRTILSVASPPWLEYSTIRFEAFSNGGLGGVARYDSVNNRSEFAPGCPSDSIVEKFEDLDLELGLLTFFEDCTVASENGAFVIDIPALNTSASACGFSGALNQDLRDSNINLELRQAFADIPDASIGMEFESNGGFLLITRSGGLNALSCPRGANCVRLAQQTYDPVAHRFIRVRETEGVSFWEYSADQIDWNTLASIPTPWSVQSGRTSFFVAQGQGLPGGTVIVDNYNTAP